MITDHQRLIKQTWDGRKIKKLLTSTALDLVSSRVWTSSTLSNMLPWEVASSRRRVSSRSFKSRLLSLEGNDKSLVRAHDEGGPYTDTGNMKLNFRSIVLFVTDQNNILLLMCFSSLTMYLSCKGKFKESRDDQCGPGSIPGPGVMCGSSLLLVLVHAPMAFHWVLRFSSLHKNRHFQIPIRSGIPRAPGLSVASATPCSTKLIYFYIFLTWFLEWVSPSVPQVLSSQILQ